MWETDGLRRAQGTRCDILRHVLRRRDWALRHMAGRELIALGLLAVLVGVHSGLFFRRLDVLVVGTAALSEGSPSGVRSSLFTEKRNLPAAHHSRQQQHSSSMPPERRAPSEEALCPWEADFKYIASAHMSIPPPGTNMRS